MTKLEESWQGYVDFPSFASYGSCHASLTSLFLPSLSWWFMRVVFAKSMTGYCDLRLLCHLPTSRRALQKRSASSREMSNRLSSRGTRIVLHLGSLKLVSSK